uniref:MFS domain-containing protein n=1 Tax=Angiostrongylus cantonensis TaxID=6313 RepID=A0A0K0CXK7_ANGCA
MDLLIFELDPSVSESFFGYIVAVYSLGQCVSSPVFGYWSNRIKQSPAIQVRLPTIFGLLIMLLGNLIYILIDMLPTGHGYAMALSRAVIGIGSSNGVLLRAYASTASTSADRSRAIGCVAAGISIGLVIGPGLQALFTPLGEDGAHFLFGWSLHIYNAPAFLAATINVSGMLLMYFLFEEKYAGLKEDNEATTLPPPDFIAVAVCIVTRFTQLSVSTNIETASESSLGGCDAIRFNWCSAMPRVNMWLYYVALCLVFEITFAVDNVVLPTLFSKVIGPRRQVSGQQKF